MNIYLNIRHLNITTHVRSAFQNNNPSDRSICTLFQNHRNVLHVDTDLNGKKHALYNNINIVSLNTVEYIFKRLIINKNECVGCNYFIIFNHLSYFVCGTVFEAFFYDSRLRGASMFYPCIA